MDGQSERLTFDQFEIDWKRKHRASIPRKQKTSSAREYFWIGFWLLVAIGAAVFSAAHTIPAAEMTILKDVPFRSDLAKTVFTVVELVIFGAAAGRHDVPWLKWLMLSALTVALAGNISSSVRAVMENGGDALNLIGGVLMSIIAPLTALAAGEMLHIQLDKRTDKKEVAQKAFDKAMRDLDAKINKDYDKYIKDYDAMSVRPSEPVRADGQYPSGYGYGRTSDAKEVVRKHLADNPQDIHSPVRDLAARLGVGKSTVSDVQRQIKDQPVPSTNGHSKGGD